MKLSLLLAELDLCSEAIRDLDFAGHFPALAFVPGKKSL